LGAKLSIMKTKIIFILCLAALILAAGCNHPKQNNKDTYHDWRNISIDSLENVLATKQLTDSDRMIIHHNLALGYQYFNFEKTVYHAQKEIAYATKLKKPFQIADGNLRLGIQYDDKSQDDSAMYYYNKALEQVPLIIKKVSQDDIQSQIYGAIANLYSKQGNDREAINYYLMMLKILERNGWRHNMMLLYKNVGETYLNLDNYKEAEAYFLKTKALAGELNDSVYISESFYQLGRIYLHDKDYPKALENVMVAYKNAEAGAEKGIEGKINYSQTLADIYLEGYNNYDKAEEYATLALRHSEEMKRPVFISQSLATLASVYLSKGMYAESERAASKALRTDTTNMSNTITLFAILAKANAYLGKPAKAAEYFDRYVKLTSERSTKNYMSALTEMQTLYDTEKKELEITQQQNIIRKQNLQRGLLAGGVAISLVFLVLLWYMLRLRDRRNRALTEVNATKDKFFSIISHDLRNPAIAQRDALQLLIKNAGSWDVDALTDYSRELLKSAEGQVELLYNLLNWAQIQTGRMAYTPTTFTLSDLLSDTTLIRNMAKNKGITLVLPESQDALITGDRNMLSTVVRNLLTNAVKFTPAGGTVTLEASQAPSNSPERGENSPPVEGSGVVRISVTDTGVGMNEEQIRNLFRLDSRQSRRGTADEQGSGLGLIVCKELLEKHGSELQVESEEGKGSRFWFTIMKTAKRS